ncbi:MAG: hypothetical protein SF097_07285 [Acidobacteriota bacterium]|nr:hypothetical protein [Acidobacteriota bacterium]
MIAQTQKRKLHSVHSLLIGREFTGEIETGQAKLKFAFSPSTAALTGGKIELTGTFSVKSAAGTRKADNVKATLLATQGSIQSAPSPPAGATASLLGKVHSGGLPATDATGSRSSVGVIYFKLSPMEGAKLGMPFDLSAVQLNVRLNPIDETARNLQFWFSVAVNAVHGESPNQDLASRSISEITGLLKS